MLNLVTSEYDADLGMMRYHTPGGLLIQDPYNRAFATIPEPASAMLLAVAGVLRLGWRRGV